jgi:hypothetical protein
MRADLLALTPESVAALANLGLVKRAQREIAAGEGPSLAEDAEGTVTGTFAGGVVARLFAGKSLKDGACTCGAPGVCRHRVAVALAYRAWRPDDRPKVEPWDPGALEDDALARALGPRAIERARTSRAAGVVITLSPASDAEPVPAAKLPTCTVRFHVPRDLAYARCDCAAGGGCEHVALAVWAFRASAGAAVTIELVDAVRGRGRKAAKAEPEPPADDRAVLAEARDLARDVINAGVVHAGPAFVERFARARTRAETAGLVWIVDALETLERAVEGYAARSARYDEAAFVAVAAEIEARVRAAGRSAELPARYVLGAGEARETLLDRVRLVSLGARLDADGRSREAQVFLADPDSGTVLVLARTWTYADGEDPDAGPALARRTVMPRVTLGALARGQVVTRAAKRRANLELVVGGLASHTSVTPSAGEFAGLPRALLVDSFAELRASLRARPPRMLRPRVLADGIVVLRVAEVRSVAYSAAQQEVTALVADAAGENALVRKRHTSVAPFAVDSTIHALSRKKPLFVCGRASLEARGIVLEPFAIGVDGALVVPDIADRVADLERPGGHGEAPRTDALAEALRGAGLVLADAAHHGLARPPPDLAARAHAVSERLSAVGLVEVGCRVARLADAPEAWMDAAIRVGLAFERV